MRQKNGNWGRINWGEKKKNWKFFLEFSKSLWRMILPSLLHLPPSFLPPSSLPPPKGKEVSEPCCSQQLQLKVFYSLSYFPLYSTAIVSGTILNTLIKSNCQTSVVFVFNGTHSQLVYCFQDYWRRQRTCSSFLRMQNYAKHKRLWYL